MLSGECKMTDVNLSSESNNLIYNWERPNDPLAPLSNLQRNIVLDLCQEIKEIGPFYKLNISKDESVDEELSSSTKDLPGVIENSRDFLAWFSKEENNWLEREDAVYVNYLDYLEKQRNECNGLLVQVEKCLKNLRELSHEYQLVSDKTNSLHQVSEELISDQMKLIQKKEAIKERLNRFKSLDKFVQSLDNSTLSIHNNNLDTVLDQLNDHIKYHQHHVTFRESHAYMSRYWQCLRRVLALVRSNVGSGLALASQQASTSQAYHYAKFQSAAVNLRPLLAALEARVDVFQDYNEVLIECQEMYVTERESLIGPSVKRTLDDLSNEKDTCALLRSASAFLLHVSLDEHALYTQFFSSPSEVFYRYLERICTSVYDKVRPLVIHMKHLESLAELCSILRLELLHEQVSTNREALAAFGSVAEQLLHDVQERLVFRALLYLRTDVAGYSPSPGDLAYPEKLHMMQQIAESLQEQELASLSRCDSTASLASQEVARISQQAAGNTSSPADLHGMWYPPLRRTLLCLSRLYRCLERSTFQGISQEAISICIEAISVAAAKISTNKSPLDGEMFQIKHLLILREQIAPFQVDFTVKEVALDFSKMKTAAFQLYNKRTQVFSLSSNNALLQFLLDGSPQVTEHLLDSRKDVDRRLKTSCESFIAHATNHLLPGFKEFLDKAERWIPKESVKKEPWGKPTEVAQLVKDGLKGIKSKLGSIQATMHLYLANKNTEFILYTPIKNNVIGWFTRLHQILISCGYSADEITQIGCPTAEQVALMLSSASLASQSGQRSRRTSEQPRAETENGLEKDVGDSVFKKEDSLNESSVTKTDNSAIKNEIDQHLQEGNNLLPPEKADTEDRQCNSQSEN